MDVVLDSNAYISDYGLRSARFAALFEYLRKTGGALLLFDIVHDEVVAQYGREFDEKVLPRLEKLELYEVDRTKIRKPDRAEQQSALSQLMKTSAEKVKTVGIDTYHFASLKEVVHRGINRIPPSNSKGEELRDVALWLAVLGYAREVKKPISFITNDSGFWRADAQEPVQQVLDDLKEYGADIRIYREIESFLADNALKKQAIPPEIANLIVSDPHVVDSIMRTILQSELPHAQSFDHQTIIAIKDGGGALYEVGDNSRFVEMSCSIDFEVVTSSRLLTSWSYSIPHADLKEGQWWIDTGENSWARYLDRTIVEPKASVHLTPKVRRKTRFKAIVNISVRLSGDELIWIWVDSYKLEAKHSSADESVSPRETE